ncbi:DUF3289 family protein [Mixta intestinalis]|uniref:DUF3289 family protein n=1 Tax=Mixta intestinalis TaxID=1615494 RepID=UPI00136D1D11
MFTHIQLANGCSFNNVTLNVVLNDYIGFNKSSNSSIRRIKAIQDKNIDWQRKSLPSEVTPQIRAKR